MTIHPRLSVIVRSYNRLGILAGLLEALLDQDHDSYEIVIVDQTVDPDPMELARIEALARDPKVNFLRFPPLGGPRARNTGVRHSRGEIIVLIDDDDLPGSRDWLRKHEANFADPRCLGVTGKFVVEGEDDQPYPNMQRARELVLSFNVLKWQRVYARTDRRKRVESLMGGNVAIRRSTLERFGLWDECTPIEDEPSLAFRINAHKAADEYLLFDPAPRMIRRLDVPGGMGKRTATGLDYGKRVFTFLHNIIGHYFPIRFVLLYPIYFLFAACMTCDWIVSDSIVHRSRLRRYLAIAHVCLVLPLYWTGWLATWWYVRLTKGELPHHPTLDTERPSPAVHAITAKAS